MICKHCEKFFSVSGEQTGNEVICPNCNGTVTVENTVVECVCPGCKQQLQFEAWMEGERAQCPSCSSMMELKRPAAPKPAVNIPRFRGAAAAPSAPPPPPPAPAPSAPAPSAPVSAEAPKPSFAASSAPKPSFAGSAPAPAAPASAEAPKPSFAGSAPAPAPSAPPVISAPPAPAAEPSAGVQAPRKSAVNESMALADKLTAVPKVEREKFASSKIAIPSVYWKIAGIGAGVVVVLLIAVSIVSSLLAPPSEAQKKRIVYYASDNQGDKLKSEIEDIAVRHRADILPEVFEECFRKRNKEMLKVLLSDKLVDPALAFNEGQSLFDFAAQKDNRWLIDVFIDSKTDLNTRLSDGSSLLECAVNDGDAKVAGLLLDNGADANTRSADGRPAAFGTVKNRALLENFIKHGLDVNIRDSKLNTLFMTAVEKKQYKTAGFLMKKDADVAAVNMEGDNAVIIMTRQNMVKHDFYNKLLKSNCGINAVNVNGESVLSLIIASRNFFKIPALLNAGMDRNNPLLKSLPASPQFRKYLQQQMDKNSTEAQPVAGSNLMAAFAGNYSKAEPVSVLWTLFLLWLGWVLTGFVSLRLLLWKEYAPWKGIFNLLALFTGPVAGIVCLCIMGVNKLIEIVRSNVAARLFAKLDMIRFYNIANEDCSKISSPEMMPVLNLCRDIFILAIDRNCSTITIAPSAKGYSVTGMSSGKNVALKNLSADFGKKVLAMLKNFANINAFESNTSQDGVFIIKDKKQINHVAMSSIVLQNEERALLKIKEPEINISSYSQLPIPAAGAQKLAELFKLRSGLLIVTGEDKNLCSKLASLVLENCAGTLGSTVWVDEKSDPDSDSKVTRLETDSKAHVTAEYLLSTLPDCKAAGITVADHDDTAVMNYAVRAAGHMVVVLVMDCVNGAEAVKLLQRSGVDTAALQSVLKLVITPLMLHKLCNCAVPAAMPGKLGLDFAAPALSANTVKKKKGCPECALTGVERDMQIFDTVVPTAEWLASPVMAEWPISKITAYILASRGTVDINEVGSCFAKFKGE